MIVAELIEQLEQLDENMEVEFAYDYGDHWHSTIASRIDSISVRKVKHSDYHNQDKVVDDDDEEDESEKTREVVILE